MGAVVPVAVTGTDVNQNRQDARAVLTVSDPSIARAVSFGPTFQGSADAHPQYRRPRPELFPSDATGILTALAPGNVTVTATTAEGVSAQMELRIDANPARSLELTASRDEARTGDVIHFEALARDGEQRTVAEAPIRYTLQAWSDPSRPETVGAGAPAQVTPDGRFVAEQAGLYTVVAMSGSLVAEQTVRITPRNVKKRIEFVGHAPVRDRVTSDLWVWEGVDGRDYAVHGTWNADGHAYFYDVTDPANMQRIDIVQVDARTVNDVKVSKDGRICVISREGASNRRNGLVILDVSDPRNVTILSRYDDQLTGGVHNVFIHENHVYALNNGRRWDVINIEDPKSPVRAARFETSTPLQCRPSGSRRLRRVAGRLVRSRAGDREILPRRQRRLRAERPVRLGCPTAQRAHLLLGLPQWSLGRPPGRCRGEQHRRMTMGWDRTTKRFRIQCNGAGSRSMDRTRLLSCSTLGLLTNKVLNGLMLITSAARWAHGAVFAYIQPKHHLKRIPNVITMLLESAEPIGTPLMHVS